MNFVELLHESQHNIRMNQEKWALVTGASSGIGKDFSKELARMGWNILLVARRQDRLQELKREIEKASAVKVEYVKADLLSANDRETVVSCFERYPIRFLVNNAGLQSRGKFESRSLEESYSLIDLNVIALVHLARAAIIHFKKTDSKCYLLNIGSLNSYIATGDSAIYSGTKAFVKSFSLALSEELNGSNISCTCFCPGGTESEILLNTSVNLAPHGQKHMMPSALVASLGIKAALSEKHSAIPGFINKLNVFLSKILPEKMMTSLASRILRSVLIPKS